MVLSIPTARTPRFTSSTGRPPSNGRGPPTVNLAARPPPRRLEGHTEGFAPSKSPSPLAAPNPPGTPPSPDQPSPSSPPQCPNATIRQQTGSQYLPDCRAY